MALRSVVYLWLAGLVLLMAPSASAADWPRFRGPEGSGVSPETGLGRSWPVGGPKVLWAVDLADGFAGAAVRDGQVYLLDRLGEKQDILRCFDLLTGKPLWDLSYDAAGTTPYPGSRNVPRVEESVVYTMGPFGQFRCVDRHSHKLVWSGHLVDDFKDPLIDVAEPPETRADKLLRTQVPRWGFTQNPLIYRDLVILAPQTQKIGLVAYDKQTGQRRWTSPYIGRSWFNHISPELMALAGVDQIVMMAQPADPDTSPRVAPPANVCGIDATTGKLLWMTQTPRPCKILVPQPIAIGQDRIFITGSYSLGSVILQVQQTGGKWLTQWVSVTDACSVQIQSPVLYKGHIYVNSCREYGVSNVGLVCLDLNAQLCWQTKKELEQGNFLIADGMAYVMDGKTGELSLFEVNATGYRQLAKAKVLAAENGNVWAPMALSDGKLIVRDRHQMKCLEVR